MAETAFVRNCWTMAAWAEEVPEGGFLARRLLGQPWLILQTSAGAWTMLADRCPHRFAPLSRGQRHGDTVRCGYHGLGFDAAGACVHNPFGTPPAGARVAQMPLVERHGALWFWPGDAALANPDQIPDFAFCTGPDHVRGVLLMDAPYELIADNLMDLSHAEFLHRETFGVNGALLDYGRQSVETDDTGAIWNKWDMPGSMPPEWAVPMLEDGARVDQSLHMRWHAPASMALFIRMTLSGEPERTVVPPMVNPHILTPETHGTTHYFYTRGPGEEAADMVRRVFIEEDEPMVHAVAEAMGDDDFWDMRPVILASDAGAIRVRRRLMQMRRAETVQPAETT